MGKTNNKKMSKIKQFIPILFFMLIGAMCGVLIVEFIENMDTAGKSIGQMILSAALLFIGMYVAIFLQIIIHEAGHLIFGIMTGYRFSSFRIGSLMWVREGDKIKFSRLSIAGTGGQCLLIPPDMKDGKYPYILYNLGGAMINFLSALIFAGLAFLSRDTGIVFPLFMMLAVIGVVFAFMNGIPLKLGTVNNDGHNIISLGKDKEALRSFWIQMKANGLIASGHRLKDMPDEWFEMPSQEAMKNSMTSVMGVLACNRLMDEMKFEEAEQAYEKLLHMDTGIIGLHRNLMVVDLIYCELIGENRQDRLDDMLDQEQKKFMKVMKKFPSVLRTECVYALLAEKDDAKASQIKARFEKMAKNYPYPSEIDGERELITYAYNLEKSEKF
ncbi:M50 family metallopeptidase [Mobilitalea sibirica]|uniref:M50 family metallopeptidase n=1 Tax=Mobilitalea sibirica TaxID=1462919 RepID=A0A8J7H0S0_9FIRM|nr:M50 family metallopeptidase [Mobilitalea sibirica]MBH1939752.1 M50 family metallopeptidase [Mobilitalea sibirica]